MGDIGRFGEKPWKRSSGRAWPRSALITASSCAGYFAAAVIVAGAFFFSGALQGLVTPETQVTSRAVRPAGSAYNAIDGDSLRTSREDVRLLGIDAPELYQTCRDARGRQWACGREAHVKLKALVSRGDVRCTATGRDRFKRALAVCSAGAVADLGEVMVRDGFAVDFMNGRYAGAEAEARRARRGIWAGQFEQPQEWRRRNPRGADRG